MTRFSCPAWWTIRASASRFPSPFSGTKRTALMSRGGVNARATAKAAALVDGRAAASGRAVSADGRAAVSPAAAPQDRTADIPAVLAPLRMRSPFQGSQRRAGGAQARYIGRAIVGT